MGTDPTGAVLFQRSIPIFKLVAGTVTAGFPGTVIGSFAAGCPRALKDDSRAEPL